MGSGGADGAVYDEAANNHATLANGAYEAGSNNGGDATYDEAGGSVNNNNGGDATYDEASNLATPAYKVAPGQQLYDTAANGGGPNEATYDTAGAEGGGGNPDGQVYDMAAAQQNKAGANTGTAGSTYDVAASVIGAAGPTATGDQGAAYDVAKAVAAGDAGVYDNTDCDNAVATLDPYALGTTYDRAATATAGAHAGTSALPPYATGAAYDAYDVAGLGPPGSVAQDGGGYSAYDVAGLGPPGSAAHDGNTYDVAAAAVGGPAPAYNVAATAGSGAVAPSPYVPGVAYNAAATAGGGPGNPGNEGASYEVAGNSPGTSGMYDNATDGAPPALAPKRTKRAGSGAARPKTVFDPPTGNSPSGQSVDTYDNADAAATQGVYAADGSNVGSTYDTAGASAGPHATQFGRRTTARRGDDTAAGAATGVYDNTDCENAVAAPSGGDGDGYLDVKGADAVVRPSPTDAVPTTADPDVQGWLAEARKGNQDRMLRKKVASDLKALGPVQGLGCFCFRSSSMQNAIVLCVSRLQ